MNNQPYPGQWRLAHIEVVNWGTFCGLHTIRVPRKGFLLTGVSGSGKSSIVDAISAVLTPRGKTRFNAAAADSNTRGADRSILTYVRGAWRRSADGETGEITSQYLRPKATWSGILLRYANGKGQSWTLIKLMHVKAGDNAPADVREVSLLSPATLQLSELEPYATNGLKVRELKAAFPDANVDTEHSRFSRKVARTLGLAGERAALLLHKTQSAKNLGSLDELFRKFMLDEPATFAKADAAVEQFTELNAAHEAVLRARRQVEHLQPLRAQSSDYDQANDEAQQVEVLLENLEAFTYFRRRELTRSAIDDALARQTTLRQELNRATEAHQAAVQRSENFRAQVEKRGGHQLSVLEAKMHSAETDLTRTDADRSELQRKLKDAQLQMPEDAAQYAELARECARLLAEAETEKQSLTERYAQASNGCHQAQSELQEIDRDLTALRKNRSNLPRDLLAARQLICQDTGLDPSTLRFAGELLQVKEEFAQWTGAIERVLRPLSLVMLVPAVHALEVSRAVNARHLGTSLRFESIGRQSPKPTRATAAHTLVHRVEVGRSPMHDWLQSRLADRFDYSCVDSVEELMEVPRGVTLTGQVKRGPQSFEKNDRHEVTDRRHWVLGFDTDAKLEQLQDDRNHAAAVLERALNAEKQAKAAMDLHATRAFVAADMVHRQWECYDTERIRAQLQELHAARATLLADDGDLRTAQHELDQSKKHEAEANDIRLRAQHDEISASAQLEALRLALTRLDEQPQPAVAPEIAQQLRSEFDAVKTQRITTHESVETEARKAQAALARRKETLRTTMTDLHQLMSRVISGFKLRWPESAQDLTDSVADRSGYLQVLGSLQADRLPEFEDRFFDMLRTQTQQNIAQLRELIQRAVREIRQRIDPINSSLLRSFYSPGHYLQIRVEDSRPAMATEFLRDLNTVTTGALAVEEDRAAAEERFAVLAQMMTQLGSSESAHRSWRQQVLDVRNHVRFTAIEVDAEHHVMDVYDSGAGRSGGQKQKLVVFCLAAALRYQLAGDAKLPSYASIVMDEAFDKADTNFTKTAMDIFAEFGFHMILATPMKLLRTLEDYVGGVALVSCQDSKASHLSEVPFEPMDDPAQAEHEATHAENNQPDTDPVVEALF
ncbi:ATP-binding protein [Glutamicibacter uratoxydans]|uniref:ATP-binding protein n=1 Tax=Glutamicibacter uratoxydans TaxID=43667 RepID=UPI003D6F3E24